MTDVEAVARLLSEGSLFGKLMEVLPDPLKGEADHLYQEGVPVADIAAQYGFELRDVRTT